MRGLLALSRTAPMLTVSCLTGTFSPAIVSRMLPLVMSILWYQHKSRYWMPITVLMEAQASFFGFEFAAPFQLRTALGAREAFRINRLGSSCRVLRAIPAA